MKAPRALGPARRALASALAIGLCACAAATAPEPPVRDVRPTTVHAGERLLVEGAGPVFRPGVAAFVVLDGVRDPAGRPLRLLGRADTPDRVVALLDEATARRLGRGSARGTSTVTVEQDGHRFGSDPRAPFELELVPPDLLSAAAPFEARWGWPAVALALLLAAALWALPIPVIAGLIVTWERKISGYMQSRLGPNRVGPWGWLQWLADGFKLLSKEDLVPADAAPRLFRAAPYLAFLGLFLGFLVIPLSPRLVAADLDMGVVYLLSVISLVVVSVLMGGWSSNSKWSVLGGMRSAAQIVSYELPGGIALLSVATLTGSLSLQRVVADQGGWPWQWNLLHSPFSLAAFVIWFIAALAEGNRTPFDLPEAESELVSGYNTEYSGFRYSLFPMVEWVNLFVIGALASALFLGGWRVPGLPPGAGLLADALGAAVFLAKDVAIVFVIIWIRWTLPRLRIDQLMHLCWKVLLPLSLVCFLGLAAWVWLIPPGVGLMVRLGMTALVGLGLAWFAGRVRHHRRRYQDLALNDVLGRVNA